MDKIDYNNMPNSEIRIRLQSLSDEYEKLKIDITNSLQRMELLDKSYNDGKVVLDKRTKGKNI